MQSPRIVTIGEGMIEIRGGVGDAGRIATGGDVLNVTIGLARLGHCPALLTALGRDPWSHALLDQWTAEGIDVSLVARHPDRVPGLYGITVDRAGERSFTYWRDRSAARDLFAIAGVDDLIAQAAHADLLFLSGITLSLYGPDGQARLVGLAAAVRARGGAVAFDGNYRPRNWPDAAAARQAFATIAPHVSIALPTLDDEAMLHGAEDPAAVAARWHSIGVAEVVIKQGAAGAWLSTQDHARAVPTVPLTPIDTSGAGDAFNAGYLSARLRGVPLVEAASAGHRLAAITVMYPGAIPPRNAVLEADG